MKQRSLVWLLLTVLALGCLSGCGAASYDSAAADTAPRPAEEMAEDVEYNATGDAGWDELASSTLEVDTSYSVGTVETAPAITPNLSEKIIYSASADMETTDFDAAIQAVEDMVAQYGGFLESSYVDGVSYSDDYYGRETYRTANFTIRVPVENFAAMTGGLGEIGHVIGIHHYAENVTAQYTDLESRLNAYRAEEAVLLEMLEQAETVAELLEIQTRLSEVRYEIEYYTSTLRNLQNQISYSTVQLYIYEVRELSDVQEVQLTYWEEIQQDFARSMRRVGRFFKNGFLSVAGNLPMILLVLVFVGGGVLILWLVIRKVRRSMKRKSDEQLKQLFGEVPVPEEPEQSEE